MLYFRRISKVCSINSLSVAGPHIGFSQFGFLSQLIKVSIQLFAGSLYGISVGGAQIAVGGGPLNEAELE